MVRIAAVSVLLLCSTALFAQSPSRKSEEYISRIHRQFPKVISKHDQETPVVVDEGTPLTDQLATDLHEQMSDMDKRRLRLPDKVEDMKRGNYGALPIGSPSYRLIVRQTNPEHATVQTFDANTGDIQTLHVRMLKYSSTKGEDHRLSGGVLVVEAGRYFAITIENNLVATQEPQLRWVDDKKPAADEVWRQDAPASNVPPGSRHSLFATNLHTHGLHVSPGGNSDNIFLTCDPRANAAARAPYLPLVYYLRPDHFAGTYWYHPHLHGGVAYQVANGMAGALIVVPAADSRIHNLDDIPEVQQANVSVKTQSGHERRLGRVLVLQQYVLSETTDKTSKGDNIWIVDPTNVNDRRELDPDNPRNPKLVIAPNPDDVKKDVTTVNGGTPLDVHLKTGQVERWRVIHAGKEGAINLTWLKIENGNAVPLDATNPELMVARIAEDGIPCVDTDAHGKFINHARTESRIAMYSGYRSDLLVKAMKAGEYVLVQDEAPRLSALRSKRPRVPPQFLARIVVDPETVTMSLPHPVAIKRCTPQDIAFPVVPAHTNPDKTVAFEFVDTEQFGVNGAPWAADAPPIEQILGKPERWLLKVNVPAQPAIGIPQPATPDPDNVMASREIKHPFHIHVNPFQVENYEGSGKSMWKDTLAIAAADGDVFIRIQANDILGTAVLHCHTLDHEDQGMMRRIKIVPPQTAVNLMPVPAPRLAPADQWPANQVHVAVLFSGPACKECNDSLRQLAKRSAGLTNLGAAITAISREPLSGPLDLDSIKAIDGSRSIETLAALAGTDRVPTHAVYLIDRHRRVRYEYIGDHPIPEFTELTRRVQELASEVE